MMQIEAENLQMAVKRLPVPLSEEQYILLEQIASAEKRSLSGQLAKIVEEWLAKYQSDRTKGKKQ